MKAVIVGIDQWDKYTKPCINSLLLHEPKFELDGYNDFAGIRDYQEYLSA